MWNIIQIKILYHPTCIKSYVQCIDTPVSKLSILNWGWALKSAIQPLLNL